MSFLSVVGRIIIVLSVIGFLIGLYESVVLNNLIIGGIALIGLIGGVYAGYLGVKVSELDEAASYWLADKLDDLTKRVQKLEGGNEVVGDVTASEYQSRKVLLGNVGYTSEEISNMKNLAEMTNEEFGHLMRAKATRKSPS